MPMEEIGMKCNDDNFNATPESNRTSGPNDDQFNPLAPRRCGPCVIGAIAHVNGPASETRTVPVSRHEAKVIIEHYLREIDEILYVWFVFGQTGSYEIRAEPYAWMRIQALIDVELVTEAEVEEMASRIIQPYA